MTPESVGLVRDCDAGLVLGKHSGRCAVWGCTPQHQDWAGSACEAECVLEHEMPTADTSLASSFHPPPLQQGAGHKAGADGLCAAPRAAERGVQALQVHRRKEEGGWAGGWALMGDAVSGVFRCIHLLQAIGHEDMPALVNEARLCCDLS